MELIDFIMKGIPLKSKPVLTKFVIKYKQQNNGILGEDAFKFVKIFNKDITYCTDCSTEIKTDGALIYILNGQHMFYLYRTPTAIEKWDADLHQHTSNNCTLFASICAIIRPLVTKAKMKKILERIDDKKGSDSSKRLAAISKHFFARGEEYFVYKRG
jgi:hypothetical protein